MLRLRRAARPAAFAAFTLLGCAQHRAHREPVATRPPEVELGHAVEGLASWYGPGFAGRQTANGEIYDPRDLTAAHRTLPFGTRVLVRNADNGRTCWVRINDRGPFVEGRIIDLSYSAAQALGIVGPGTARVALELGTRAPQLAPGEVHAPTAVALPPIATEAPLADPLPATDGAPRPWSVQVGAFALADNAEHLAQDLARRGLESRVVMVGSLAKVRVGAWTSASEAQEAAEALARDGFETTVVRDDEPALAAQR